MALVRERGARPDILKMTTDEVDQPRRDQLSTAAPLCSMRAAPVLVSIAVVPLVGVFSCVAISLIRDFEGATWTHCKVRNFLPSLSAALGNNTPQRYINRFAIAGVIAPRTLASFAHYAWYASNRPGGCQVKGRGLSRAARSAARSRSAELVYSWATVALLVSELAELMSLLVVTFVGSTEDYDIHEMAFYFCQSFSLTQGLLQIWLFAAARADRAWTQLEIKSYTWKWRLWVINLTSTPLLAYFFYRHMTYCEPGVYTMFALLEYTVVAAGALFDATIIWDLRGYTLALSPPLVDNS